MKYLSAGVLAVLLLLLGFVLQAQQVRSGVAPGRFHLCGRGEVMYRIDTATGTTWVHALLPNEQGGKPFNQWARVEEPKSN